MSQWYLRLFPATTYTHEMCFASRGKTIRPHQSNSIPALVQGRFGVPANFQQNRVFNFSNQDRLDAQVADPALLQQSVDMLGILINNFTPEASAQSENSDRDLPAVFAHISGRLISSVCTPSRSQQRSESQESTDMLVPPARSSSLNDQASSSSFQRRRTDTEQSQSTDDSPLP